jgi:hypothetical protein
MSAALLHFEKGVPIDDLGLKPSTKARLARVEHVYWQWVRNPFLDVMQLFRQINKSDSRFVNEASALHGATRDKMLFDFVVEHVAPPSRRMDEAKVRAAADRVMRIGMETDNGKDIIEGAKLLTKVARLDQPEDQRGDMSKVAFLPSVVVTDISAVDDTKQNIDDAQTRAILDKYGGYVDEKRKMVDDRVEAMLAEREAEEKTDKR